jgi:hypothetical protein
MGNARVEQKKVAGTHWDGNTQRWETEIDNHFVIKRIHIATIQ